MEILVTNKRAQLEALYPTMAASYADAFARSPWREASICADPDKPQTNNCVGGFSALVVGEWCGDCRQCPSEAAYPPEVVTAKFDELLERGAFFYVEKLGSTVLMTTVGVPRRVEDLVADKYADVPELTDWPDDVLGDRQFVWLEESFANLRVRPKGNMTNRKTSVELLASAMGLPQIATRTVNPRVVFATLKAFPETRLWLPDENSRLSINQQLLTECTSLTSQRLPDRRAFLSWEVATSKLKRITAN